MSLILDDVIEEHAEETAFLWQQRDAAVRAPDYDIEELAEIDDRVEAHLDGLRIGGGKSWSTCKDLGWDLAGEYFTAMSIAILLSRQNLGDEVIAAAEGDKEAIRGVVSALGWVEPRLLNGLVKDLLLSDSPYRRMIGISACALHRVHPRTHLFNALQSDDSVLLARALKAAGELGDIESLHLVKLHLEHPDNDCRFQAARTAVLLGDRSAVRILSLFVSSDNVFRRDAMNVVFRVLEPAMAQQFIKQLANDKTQLRYALIASGIHGDPIYLPALMRQFANEELARVAGEAFEMITGLNIFRESLEVIPEVPDQSQQPGSEDEDDDEEDIGEDMGLVIPDPEKMTPWYEKNKGRFKPGQRYLCGQPVSIESCTAILISGQQRQRQAAALELVLAEPGRQLFETRAMGERQHKLLLSGKF